MEGVTRPSSVPHLRRSCEACRFSKSRCIPGDNPSGLCQRCARDRKECFYAVARPRPKRAKTSRSRVEEMELKLDGIFALLASGPSSVLDESTVPDLSPASHSSAPSIESAPLQGLPDLMISPVKSFKDRHTFSAPDQSPLTYSQFDPVQDVIGKGILRFEEAEQLLEVFRSQTVQRFPFLVVRPHDSLDKLRREKPFFLLGALTMASVTNPPVQKQLEHELRETLSTRVVMNAEKNLDLLQGLLLYLAWYQYNFRPDRQQIYQLSQLAVAMAVDLNITKPFPKSEVGMAPFDLLGPTPSRSSKPTLVLIETKRTFIACYFITSSLSTGFRRPNGLKYTDFLGDCCQAVVDAKEMESDRFIPCFIKLQKFFEEVNAAFDYDRYQQLPPLGALRTEMMVKTFNTRLTDLEASFPFDVTSNILLMSYQLRIYINEVGFHASADEMVSMQPSCHDWYSSSARGDTIARCLESAKAYFEFYLTLSHEDLRYSILMETFGLVYGLLVLGRFTSGINAPNLDTTHLRKTANMAGYLDALLSRFVGLITVKNSEEQKDFFWHLRRVFRCLKIWHEEYDTLVLSDEVNELDSADLAFMKILCFESPQEKCFNITFEDTRTQQSPGNDMWENTEQDWPATMDPLDMLSDPTGLNIHIHNQFSTMESIIHK